MVDLLSLWQCMGQEVIEPLPFKVKHPPVWSAFPKV